MIQQAINSVLNTGAALLKASEMNKNIKEGFAKENLELKQQNAELVAKQAKTNLDLQQKRYDLGELKTMRNINKARKAYDDANKTLMDYGQMAHTVDQSKPKRGGTL